MLHQSTQEHAQQDATRRMQQACEQALACSRHEAAAAAEAAAGAEAEAEQPNGLAPLYAYGGDEDGAAGTS